ncbi:hypothetical protein [Pseudomonas sp. CFBP13506]|uniref:hypothetical protein n=1 Tax=Pseudomonas sp. CFBP13506 TaxID=2184010 RepID=UPI0015B0CFAD|nr:hypothetical protein [Pseudomonas sp. CFBP13506]
MARKKVPAQASLNARVENPFIHIPFQSKDLSSIERGGGGGGKELVDVDTEYRKALSKALFDASSALSHEQTLYPQALTHLVLKLRDTGIAKSHRPIKLAEEASLEPAGHARIGEMLVGASANSLNAFKRVILERDRFTSRRERVVEEHDHRSDHIQSISRLHPLKTEAMNPDQRESLERKNPRRYVGLSLVSIYVSMCQTLLFSVNLYCSKPAP